MASVLLVLLSIVMAVGSISAQPDPGCQTHCGGVEIPYPFGIGAECAIEKSFEINCTKTDDGEKPFIFNVEVENISVSQGKTRALNAVSTYCYDSNTRRMKRKIWLLNFSRSPYRFSDVDNKFIVMGCNTLAYIYNRYNMTGYTTACASVCRSLGALTNGSCLGVGCCENAITRGLTRYDVSFYSVYNDTNSSLFNPCSYAVMVETEAFSFNSTYITNSAYVVLT
jgi:hypothetical protein